MGCAPRMSSTRAPSRRRPVAAASVEGDPDATSATAPVTCRHGGRMPRTFPARLGLAVLTAVAALALAGCSGGAGAARRWDARAVGQSIAGLPFTPVLVNSNLGVGQTRLALALLRQDQTLVNEATISLRLYRLADDPEKDPTTATAAGTFPMTARSLDVGDGRTASLQTMFTTMVNLDRAGRWGAELDVDADGRRSSGLRVTMIVQAHTSEPAVGDAAPRTKQRTLADTPNIAELDSSTHPNPGLHQRTVADAIATGRPVVVAFATPAFCQTRFCGPVLDAVVLPAWKTYADRVEFVHIEPFDLAAARRGSLIGVPAADEWRLKAEPFLAVIDRRGNVAAKFEGIIAPVELTEAIDAVLTK